MAINRTQLLNVVNLVRPALSSQQFIPALSHIRFADGRATTFNDVAALEVEADFGLNVCIPGDLLARSLSSFSAEEVLFQKDKATDNVVVSSGRSRLTMPTLPVKDFPFDLPNSNEGTELSITDDILDGIKACLVAVGNDATHPAQMGVTLDTTEAGKAVLYSTDNYTLSAYYTPSKVKLPGGTPIILPSFFCEQLLALAKQFPKEDLALVVHLGAVVVEVGRVASLFTKTLVDVSPMDYAGVISKYLDVDTVQKKLEPIPVGFDSAINRALLVLGNETDKVSTLSVDGSGIQMHTSGPNGEVEDQLEFDGPKTKEFHVDPGMVSRGLKSTTHLAMFPKVLVLADKTGDFMHLVAHVASK